MFLQRLEIDEFERRNVSRVEDHLWHSVDRRAGSSDEDEQATNEGRDPPATPTCGKRFVSRPVRKDSSKGGEAHGCPKDSSMKTGDG